jgi:hypothetical protein
MQNAKRKLSLLLAILFIASSGMFFLPSDGHSATAGDCFVWQGEEIEEGLYCEEAGCFRTPCCYFGDCDTEN